MHAAQRIGERAPTHAHSTCGVDDVILDGQRRVEDRPYHASAHTVNHQGDGRANSITPFVVYCTRGSVVVGGHLSLHPLRVPRARGLACIHKFRANARPTYRRAGNSDRTAFRVIRASRGSPISFLSLFLSLSSRPRSRELALSCAPFRVPRVDREAQSDSRSRPLLETARVFP